MKSFFSKNKKKIIAISSFFLFASLFFLYPSVASAGDGDGATVAKVLGWIIWPFIFIMGQLATLLLGVLIKIAQYNDFINSSAVSYGWVVVRDLCNMFFVLILLIIAFASILRVDSYNLKTWLPKLVIMAVLINFSKLICGIFIDFAQVIMLTFVNAFKDIAGANLTDMLGISKILSFNESNTGEVTAWTIIGSMVLALIFSVIAVVVIVAMLAMLAMRIVLIWIYVVLSPIAYLMAAFPQGQSNSQRWWSDFSKNVIVGPVLAFFIWLAFASLGGVEGEAEIEKIRLGEAREKSGLGDENSTNASAQLLTEAGSEGNLIKMIISIGMLLGGLMLAQEMGDRSGKIAGKGLAKLQTMGAGSLKLGKRAVGIERAQNAIKGYQQRKESDRSALAQKDAGRLNTAVGKVKQGVAYLPNQAAKGTSNLLKRGFGLNDSKLENREKGLLNKEDEIKNMKKAEADLNLKGSLDSIDSLENEKKERLSENNNIRSQADNLEASQNKYKSLERDLYFMPQNDPARASKQQEFDEEAEKLKSLKQEAGLSKNADEATTMAKVRELKTEHLVNEANITSQYDNDIAAKKVETVTKYNSLTGDSADFNTLKTNSDAASQTISDKIKEKENEVLIERQSLSNDKEMADKVDRGVGAVVGGTLGAVVGSAFGAPMIGMTAGAIGGWKSKDKLNNAGQKDLNLASNYNSSAINKHKEDMKDDDVDTLRKKSEDYSKNVHERTAAKMMLLEKGALSDSEARVTRDKIKEDFSGDNKTLNQLDSVLASSYQSLSSVFEDLKKYSVAPASGETPEETIDRNRKKEKTEDKIIKGIVSGNIKIDNVDDQEVLNMIMPKLANTISATNLANIHKSQTSKKQEMIEKSLKISADNGDDKSHGAFVKITSNLGGSGSESQKTKYLEKINKNDFSDLLDSSKGINSVADWIKNNNAGILDEIKNAAGDTKKTINILNRVLKKAQLGPDNTKDKSLVNKLIRALEKKDVY